MTKIISNTNKGLLMENTPICDSATSVLLRSHKGLKGSPSSRSLSPCLKNSSSNNIVQWWCRSHRLAGCEMSQQWRTSDNAF